MKLTKEIITDLKKDAVDCGNALNDAGWKFDSTYHKIMGESTDAKLFNNIKDIIREVIIEYLDKLEGMEI